MMYRLVPVDGAAVGVRDGRITAGDEPFDLTVDLGAATLRPGLINAHDHLHRNHYPRLGVPPYPDAYAWGCDLHGRWRADIARHHALDRRDALLFGALKNLIAGATSVVHHDRWEPAFDGEFPVRVIRTRAAHSIGLESELAAAITDAAVRRPPFCIHLAEGTNRAAALEVRALERLGLLDERLVAVHVVGPDADGVRRLRASGAAVVWCPSSNRFLYGRTAPRELLEPGIDVLIGSDSLLSGDGTLLDELRLARALGPLDDARLLDAVGAVAARRLGVPHPSLEPGAPADLVAFACPVLDARPADVELVIVDGVPRLGDDRFAELFEYCDIATEPLSVAGRMKRVARPLATTAYRVIERVPECARVLQ